MQQYLSRQNRHDVSDDMMFKLLDKVLYTAILIGLQWYIIVLPACLRDFAAEISSQEVQKVVSDALSDRSSSRSS